MKRVKTPDRKKQWIEEVALGNLEWVLQWGGAGGEIVCSSERF